MLKMIAKQQFVTFSFLIALIAYFNSILYSPLFSSSSLHLLSLSLIPSLSLSYVSIICRNEGYHHGQRREDHRIHEPTIPFGHDFE